MFQMSHHGTRNTPGGLYQCRRWGCLGRERERSPAHSEGDMAEEALNAEKEALDSYFQGEDADIRVRAALRPVFWVFFGV